MKHRHLKTENFQHLNTRNNLHLEQTNPKSENLERLRLERFQHLTPAVNTPESTNGDEADEDSIEVEYIKCAGDSQSNEIGLENATADASLDDLSCTVDIFISCENSEDSHTEPVICAQALDIDLGTKKQSASVPNDELEQLSQIVDIFTDQI